MNNRYNIFVLPLLAFAIFMIPLAAKTSGVRMAKRTTLESVDRAKTGNDHNKPCACDPPFK